MRLNKARKTKSILEAAEDVEAKQNESFRLDKSVDPLAVVALILAVVSSVWQVFGYLHGSQVDLILPELVEVRASRDGWTIVNAQMSYVNTGRMEYSAVVKQESVRFRVIAEGATSPAPKSAHLFWQSFITTDYLGENKLRTDEDAHPFVVPGAGSVSHQTSFFPRSQYCPGCAVYANYISWSDLLQEIAHARGLELTFVAKVFDGRTIRKTCVIPVDDRMRTSMKKNRWHTRECQVKEGS